MCNPEPKGIRMTRQELEEAITYVLVDNPGGEQLAVRIRKAAVIAFKDDYADCPQLEALRFALRQLQRDGRLSFEDTDGYVSPAEFARMSGISRQRVSQLFKAGRIAGATQILGRMYIPKDAALSRKIGHRRKVEAPEGYATPRQIAEAVGVTKSDVYYRIGKGQLPGSYRSPGMKKATWNVPKKYLDAKEYPCTNSETTNSKPPT